MSLAWLASYVLYFWWNQLFLGTSMVLDCTGYARKIHKHGSNRTTIYQRATSQYDISKEGSPLGEYLVFITFLGPARHSFLLQLDVLCYFDLVRTYFTAVLSIPSLPKYLNNVHGFDLSQAGFISALPYICMFTVIVAQVNFRVFSSKVINRF